jgi:hypothetical protein
MVTVVCVAALAGDTFSGTAALFAAPIVLLATGGAFFAAGAAFLAADAAFFAGGMQNLLANGVVAQVAHNAWIRPACAKCSR